MDADAKRLQLTTHRLRHEPRGQLKGGLISIFLEHISSVQLSRHANPFWLGLGVACLAGGFFMMAGHAQEAGLLCSALGVVFLVLYFTMRKHVIKVSSNGGDAIILATQGMKTETVNTFIDTLEKAMNDRLNA